MGWIVDKTQTYTRTVKSPDGESAEVTLRPLDAGDRAELSEIRLMLSDDEGRLEAGKIKTLTVQKALVGWTITDANGGPLEVTEATIRALEPDVFEQIFDLVSFGAPRPPADGKPGPGPGVEPVIEGRGLRAIDSPEDEPGPLPEPEPEPEPSPVERG